MQRLNQFQQAPLVLVNGIARGDQQFLLLQLRSDVRHLHIVNKRNFTMDTLLPRYQRAFVHALNLQRLFNRKFHLASPLLFSVKPALWQ